LSVHKYLNGAVIKVQDELRLEEYGTHLYASTSIPLPPYLRGIEVGQMKKRVDLLSGAN